MDEGHVYWAVIGNYESDAEIGRANLFGEAVQPEFITGGGDGPCGVAVDSNPTNEFTLGKAKPNKRKGTAKLPVELPSGGHLVLQGKGMKRIVKQVAKNATDPTVKLAVKSKGKAKKKLKRKGKAKVNPEVTFTPTGGLANIKTTTVKLIKKRH